MAHITGYNLKGVSLETCTAIGAVPAVISGYVESKKKIENL